MRFPGILDLVEATQLERDEEPLPVAKANFGPIPKTKEGQRVFLSYSKRKLMPP